MKNKMQKNFLLFVINKKSKTLKKQRMKQCKELYCNVGCKNTIFEKGKGISKGFTKKIKRVDDNMKILFENERKKIFGSKTNVLKDNFYEKIPQQKVLEMKKKGAISGCINNYNGILQ